MQRNLTRIVAALAFLSLAAFAVHRIVALDVWWHLETGRWILAHGIPAVDPFSYAFPDRPWVELHWLYCVTAWLIFDKLGPNAVILTKLVLVATSFGLLYSVARERARWAAPLGVALATVAGFERLMVRPELVTFVGLALTLLCVQRYRERGDVRWLYPLPAFQLVWANCQALSILGPVVQWIVLAADAFERRLPDAFRPGVRASAASPRPALLAAALTTVVGLANPYFLEGFLFPFRLFDQLGGQHFIGRSITEFNSPFSELLFRADFRTISYLVVAGVSAAGFAYNRRRFPLSRLALWLAFLVLSIRAQRNIALFGFVAAYATMLNLDEGVAEDEPGAQRARCVCLSAVALYALCVLLLVPGNWLYRSQGLSRRFGFGVSDRVHPVRALEFVRQAGLPRPVLNGLGDGGYVMFEGGEKSVYVDGRVEIYGAENLREALPLTTSGAGFTETARRLGVRTALVRHRPAHQGLVRLLESAADWVLVYYDERHLIYLRVDDEPTAALARRHAVRWDDPAPRQVAPPQRLRAWRGPRLPLPSAPDNLRHHAMGTLFVSLGRYAPAVEQFEAAVREDPGHDGSALHLGLFYRALGRDDEADELLARVPRRHLEDPEVLVLAGQIELWARRPELALRSFERAAQLAGDPPEILLRVARAAIAASAFDAAESTLLRLDEIAGQEAEVAGLRGAAAAKQNRYDEAAAHLERSLRIDPAQPRVLRLLAAAYSTLGRTADAASARARAEALEAGAAGPR
ncbi:MAG: tetratricopeptide repeat protein [bacterium]|nr:tetratricopeptide repeat protein [bacterium]